jgi:hypothetical protein
MSDSFTIKKNELLERQNAILTEDNAALRKEMKALKDILQSSMIRQASGSPDKQAGEVVKLQRERIDFLENEL